MPGWYYSLDNKQSLGPVSGEELRSLVLAGTILPGCMVRQENGTKWVQASRVKGLFPNAAVDTSSPVATVLVPCPKCNRSIPLQEHELSLTIECASCSTHFIPAYTAAPVPGSSTPPEATPVASIQRRKFPPWVLVAAIGGIVLISCCVVAIVVTLGPKAIPLVSGQDVRLTLPPGDMTLKEFILQ
jgi:hypothetical protein